MSGEGPSHPFCGGRVVVGEGESIEQLELGISGDPEAWHFAVTIRPIASSIVVLPKLNGLAGMGRSHGSIKRSNELPV